METTVKFQARSGDVFIDVLDVEYHRNGIGGAPFYAVVFQYLLDGSVHTALGTIGVDDFEYDADGAKVGPARGVNPDVRVFGLDSVRALLVGEKFRGDYFHPVLARAVILAAQ